MLFILFFAFFFALVAAASSLLTLSIQNEYQQHRRKSVQKQYRAKLLTVLKRQNQSILTYQNTLKSQCLAIPGEYLKYKKHGGTLDQMSWSLALDEHLRFP